MPEKETQIYSDVDAIAIVDAFIANTKETTEKRLANFILYEQFVIDGTQWDEDEKPEGDKPCITFNKSEDFINTYLAKLFPRSMESGTLQVGVKVKEKDKSKKEQFEKEIIDIYEKNKIKKIILEQAQNFFIGGDACFYYPKDQISGSAKIVSIDPTIVYLGWTNGELTQFAFEDEISLAEAKKDEKKNWLINFINKILDTKNEASQQFKPVKRITYWDKKAQIVKVDSNVKVSKNEDGFIPFSWIPNQPKAHRHEGIPEAKKLVSLEKENNKSSSRFALRVKENTKPTLAAFTDMETSDVKRDEISGILPFGKGEDAKFLTLAESKETLDYLAGLEKSMNNKMACNDAVSGEIKSNISSLSMVYYFSPLMDRIGLKRVYWDEAFRDLNKAILTYKFGAKEYQTDPIYEPVLLTDAETKIKNVVLMLQNKLISYEDAIDQLRGSENSIELFKKIIEELQTNKEILVPQKSNNNFESQTA